MNIEELQNLAILSKLEIKKEQPLQFDTPHSVDDTTYIAAYGAGTDDDDNSVDVPGKISQ